MPYFLQGITIVLSVTMLLVSYRVFRGPTVFDRLVGLGVIGTKSVLLLLLLGFLFQREDVFVDISLAYAALGFIGTLMLSKYFERKGGLDE